MKATKDEIRRHATKAIKRHEHFVDEMKGSSNPQVIEMIHRTQGQIIGLRAMLDAINGDLLMFRVESGGII